MTTSPCFVLILALAASQDARSELQAAVTPLAADVRAWITGEPPGAADIQELCAELERLEELWRATQLAAPLEAREVTPRANDPLVGIVHQVGNLGHRLGELDRPAEAHTLVRWCVEHSESHADLATTSWACEWLGQEAWIHNALDEAADWTARAAALDQRRRAPHDRTRHLADVARIRLVQGRFDPALEALEGAEQAAREAGSRLAERMAAAVHGSVLFELGRHREALERCLGRGFESAETVQDEPPRDETQVRLDILASDILADVGRLESALVFARRARATALAPEVARTAPLLHLEAELSLGLLLADLGHCDEALAILDGAAAEFERNGDERGLAWTAKNRGFARFAAGRVAEARPDFEHAWRAGGALGVPFLEGFGAMGVAESMVLGALDGAWKDLASADAAHLEAALQAAERVAGTLHDRTLEWRAAALRGHMHLERDEPGPALEQLGPAVALIERWRRRLGVSGLVEHALRQRTDPYRDAAFAAARLGRVDEAMTFAGLLQSRVQDELAARRSGPLSGLATPALEELRERVVRLERRLEDPEDGADTHTVRGELERAEDELDAALLGPELAAGRTLTRPGAPLPLARLGTALTEQGLDLALVYLVGVRETLVLRVDAGGAPHVEGQRLDLGRAELLTLVERLRTPLERLAAGELDLAHLDFDVEAARTLYRRLVEPLGLARGARVALVTDEALAQIPFELFVSGGVLLPYDFARPFAHLAGLAFLGDEQSWIRYGSLARIALPSVERRGPALVFVAPEELAPAGALEEGRAVVHALPGARLVLDAHPSDVLREASGASLLHFAAHGRIDVQRPAHGHLLLGGERAGESARLESWQAAELELDGALVVLSACDSGRGAWRAGAGPEGLANGFFQGGAREVVASLWAVDDRVTARFWELFYAELARGSATPEALRAARSALRKEDDPRGFALAHPAFWAAWTLER